MRNLNKTVSLKSNSIFYFHSLHFFIVLFTAIQSDGLDEDRVGRLRVGNMDGSAVGMSCGTLEEKRDCGGVKSVGGGVKRVGGGTNVGGFGVTEEV